VNSLRRKIYDLFENDYTKKFDAVTVSEKIGVDLLKVNKALYAMKDNGTLKSEGPKPHSYRLNENPIKCKKNYEISKIKGLGKKIIDMLMEEESPLSATEIADKMGGPLSSTRYVLCSLKKKGFIKALGCTPYSYEIIGKVKKSDIKDIPEKADTEILGKSIKPDGCVNSVLEALYGEVSLEKEFLIATITSGKTDIRGYAKSGEFTAAFAALQKEPGLEKISGYRRIKCSVVLTPEIE